MKSVKELNKACDEAESAIKKTVDAVIDPRSLVECDRFIRSETALGEATGEGVISGFATVGDINVGIFAVNGNVLKGGIGKANAAKIAKCVSSAVKTDSPVIGIIDSCGARFAEGIEAMEGYAGIFSAFSFAYGAVPTVLVVKGNNFGLLSYLTSVCDFTVCYDKSVTATSSPLILAAGTTEDVSKVGTGEAMAKEGVASVVVKSDEELGACVRSLIALTTEIALPSDDDGNRVCRSLAAEASAGEVIAEAFDAGTFVEIKKDYGKEMITGYARLNGIAVGVVACNEAESDGKISFAAANKAIELINTCDSFGLPIVNIVDCKGVKSCLKCQGDTMRSVGDLIYAYNVADVAKVALVKGNAIGAGYVALASKSVCDYTVAWENATIGMLDNVQSAELVYSADIAKAKDRKAASDKLAAAYGEENTAAVVVAQKGYIDNVIDPAFTRQYLIAAVQAFIDKR